MPDDLPKLIYEIASKSRILKSLFQSEEESPELTERQIRILSTLREKKQMTIQEIGKCLPGVAASTVSSDVTKLWMDKGLLVKEIDRNDQRTKIVRLTSEGEKTLDLVFRNMARIHAMIIEALDLDEQKRVWAIEILKNALNNLDVKIRELCESPNK
jgi:DNA-binding MarR family transcriptional regulator